MYALDIFIFVRSHFYFLIIDLKSIDITINGLSGV